MALSHGISEAGLGGQLFERRCALVVAPPLASFKDTDPSAVVIEAGPDEPTLRVVFKVKKHPGHKPNTASITVYNLAETSRALMQSKGSRVILRAGYEGAQGTIFHGDSLTIDHQHEGPNWLTKIEAKDGGRAYLRARVKESFLGRVPGGTAIMRVAESLGLGLGNLPALVPSINASHAHEHGWVAHGRAATELTRLLKAVGLDWSVHDGELVVRRPGTSATEIVRLDEDHGLIGTPEHVTSEKKGADPLLKLRSLLRYELRPDVRIDLESAQHSGVYTIKAMEHEGDTDAGPWYTTMEAKSA